MHDNKYVKIKIKICNNRINTNFQGNEIPEDNEYCTCLSVILLDSVIEIDNGYYPQIFLEQWKCTVKKQMIINTINEELNLTLLIKSDNDKSNESDED